MPRPRTWKDLLPGLLALGALTALAASVLIFGGVGAMHGRTVALYAVVPQATGLIKGSEVWLLGRKVGVVQSLAFRPATADTTERIVVALKVAESTLPYIRSGTTVDIRPGGNMIGAPVVAIAPGAAGRPSIQPGDTLRAASGKQFARARADFATATQGVPAVLANVRLLGAQLRSARGTLGALGIGGAPRIGQVTGAASRAVASARSGRGTLGLALGQDAARRRATEAMAAVDSLRALLSNAVTSGSVGRFRRDSTLPAAIEAVRTDLDEATTLLGKPSGTAGRLQEDSALTRQLARSRAALADLAADVKRNPLRYIAF